MDPNKKQPTTRRSNGRQDPELVDAKPSNPNPKGLSTEGQTDRLTNEGGPTPASASKQKDSALDNGPQENRPSIPGSTPEKVGTSIPPQNAGKSAGESRGAKNGNATAHATNGEKTQESCDQDACDAENPGPKKGKPAEPSRPNSGRNERSANNP